MGEHSQKAVSLSFDAGGHGNQAGGIEIERYEVVAASDALLRTVLVEEGEKEF